MVIQSAQNRRDNFQYRWLDETVDKVMVSLNLVSLHTNYPDPGILRFKDLHYLANPVQMDQLLTFQPFELLIVPQAVWLSLDLLEIPPNIDSLLTGLHERSGLKEFSAANLFDPTKEINKEWLKEVHEPIFDINVELICDSQILGHCDKLLTFCVETILFEEISWYVI